MVRFGLILSLFSWVRYDWLKNDVIREWGRVGIGKSRIPFARFYDQSVLSVFHINNFKKDSEPGGGLGIVI